MTTPKDDKQTAILGGPGLPLGKASPLVNAIPRPPATALEKAAELVPMPLSVDHASFAGFTSQYVREHIQLADQKAAFVFATSTALLAFLYSHHASLLWLAPILTWSFLAFLSFVSMAGLAITSLLAVATVFPRLRGAKPGLLFFNAIAAHADAAEYVASVGASSPAQLASIQLQHCHDLARVCRRKYRCLRAAFTVGAVAAAATLTFLVLGPSTTP